jgi:hypothetical protein
MAKMIFSLGFWMTIVLFIAMGYALGYALDESGVESPYGDKLTSVFHDQYRTSGADVADRNKCAPQTTSRDDDLSFRQSTNLQGADRTYAPGLSFTIARRPDRIKVCPGPIEVPPLY